MTLGASRGGFRYPQPAPLLPIASGRRHPVTGRVEFSLQAHAGQVRRTGLCKFCRADIAWVVTGLGKKMPLDLKSERFDEHRYWYESHFARCNERDRANRRAS